MTVDEDPNQVGGHCPRCGAEYSPGVSICAEDGTSLLPGPAPEEGRRNRAEPEAPPEPSWVEVASLPRSRAILLAGRLKAEGIEAAVDPPDVAGWPGYPWDGMAERVCRVLVREDRVQDALTVIGEVRRAQ